MTGKGMKLFILPLLLFPSVLSAEDNPFMHLYFGTETRGDLNSWTDSGLITRFRKMEFGDEEFKQLYREFRQLIVSGQRGREKLSKVIDLGKKIHNLRLALSEEKLTRYGDLLEIMRDILYMEAQQLAELVNRNAQKIYFYTVDSGWLNYLDKEYSKRFASEDKN